MEKQALDEKSMQTESRTVKDDLAQMEQAAKIKDDRIRQLEDSMHRMQQNLDAVAKVLSLNPPLDEVDAALRRRHNKQGSPAF